MSNIYLSRHENSAKEIWLMQRFQWFRFFLFTLLFFSYSYQLSAQLNLNVGYNGAYIKNKLTHEILQRYNTDTPLLNNPFKKTNVMGGIVVGARYKLGLVSFLLQWMNKRKNLKSSRMDSMAEENLTKDLLFRYNNYSAGLELFIEAFSFGGTIDYSRFSIITEETPESSKSTILSNDAWSSHFFISFRIHQNSNLSIAIQPYLHWPWSNIDLFKLEESLNPDFAASADANNYKEHFKNVGISLIFYNGEH